MVKDHNNNEKKKAGYISIPFPVLTSDEFSTHLQASIYGLIHGWNITGQSCKSTITYMARIFKCNRRTIIRAIKEMLDNGLIRFTKGTYITEYGAANEYWVVKFPEELHQPERHISNNTDDRIDNMLLGLDG